MDLPSTPMKAEIRVPMEAFAAARHDRILWFHSALQTAYDAGATGAREYLFLTNEEKITLTGDSRVLAPAIAAIMAIVESGQR